MTDCEKAIVFEKRMLLHNIVAKLTLCMVASSFGWKRGRLWFCSADDFAAGRSERGTALARPAVPAFCNSVTCDGALFSELRSVAAIMCYGASPAAPANIDG